MYHDMCSEFIIVTLSICKEEGDTLSVAGNAAVHVQNCFLIDWAAHSILL